jgi:uncharacterized protein
MRIFLALLLGLFLLNGIAQEKHRLVLQVSDNDPAKSRLALNNAQNVQAELGKDNVQIEIVAYGPGLEMLKMESKVSDRLAQALDNRVALIACENTEAPEGRLGLRKALTL